MLASGTLAVMLASGTLAVMLASGTLAVMLASGTLAVMLASGTLAVMLASGTFASSVTLASSVPFFITFVTNSLASSSVNFPVFTSSLIKLFSSSSASVVDIPLEVDIPLALVAADVLVVVVEIVIIGTLLFGEYLCLKKFTSSIQCTTPLSARLSPTLAARSIQSCKLSYASS